MADKMYIEIHCNQLDCIHNSCADKAPIHGMPVCLHSNPLLKPSLIDKEHGFRCCTVKEIIKKEIGCPFDEKETMGNFKE